MAQKPEQIMQELFRRRRQLATRLEAIAADPSAQQYAPVREGKTAEAVSEWVSSLKAHLRDVELRVLPEIRNARELDLAGARSRLEQGTLGLPARRNPLAQLAEEQQDRSVTAWGRAFDQIMDGLEAIGRASAISNAHLRWRDADSMTLFGVVNRYIDESKGPAFPWARFHADRQALRAILEARADGDPGDPRAALGLQQLTELESRIVQDVVPGSSALLESVSRELHDLRGRAESVPEGMANPPQLPELLELIDSYERYMSTGVAA